jgi:hypothetical protein
MKYHYRPPQEVKEQYPGKPVAANNPFRNRTFWMILADCALLLLIFGILYKSGSLNSFFPSPADLRIAAEVQEENGQKHIRVQIRNDADRTVNPHHSESPFSILSAALRTGPVHSDDFADQLELELNSRELPDPWEVGRIVSFIVTGPAGKSEQWHRILSGEAVLILRFKNLNREVKLQ